MTILGEAKSRLFVANLQHFIRLMNRLAQDWECCLRFEELFKHMRWLGLNPGHGLALDEDTFKDQARIYPILNPLTELQSSLSQIT